MDIDGDGYLSMYELEYFYEEQLQKMESLGIETLPFQDCLCQVSRCGFASAPRGWNLFMLRESYWILAYILGRIFVRIFGFFYIIHSRSYSSYKMIYLDSRKIFQGRITAKMDSRILAKFLALALLFVQSVWSWVSSAVFSCHFVCQSQIYNGDPRPCILPHVLVTQNWRSVDRPHTQI